MKCNLYVFLLVLLLLTSCNRIANKTKEGINKGGEVVGETATEFFEGVSEGVDKTLECDVKLSKHLTSIGLKTGVYNVNSGTNGNNNQLTLYLIFNNDINEKIVAKAYNKNGLEIGRAKTTINGNAGDAGYYDFEFDTRTDIGFRNKIVIE